MAITIVSTHFGDPAFIEGRLELMFSSVHHHGTDEHGHWFRVNGDGVPDKDERIFTIGGMDSPPYGWITEADFEKYASDPDMYEKAIHRIPSETASLEGLATGS